MIEFLLLICLIILVVLVWKPVKKAVLSALAEPRVIFEWAVGCGY